MEEELKKRLVLFFYFLVLEELPLRKVKDLIKKTIEAEPFWGPQWKFDEGNGIYQYAVELVDTLVNKKNIES